MTTTTRTEQPAVGRVARWKLTEPARLYLWPVTALLLVCAVLEVAAGEWAGAGMLTGAALLLLVAIDCARASVYCPRAVVQAVMRARQ